MAPRRIPLAAGVLAFIAYAWLAAPGMYWLDSQELGSAAVRLGVPHPTGFPLFVFAGRVAAFLPVGELAFRVHLLCAACGALAVGTVAALVMDLAGDDLTAGLAAAGAALVVGASFTFFRQATVTEVYAPTAAFLALALRWAVRVIRGGRADVGLGLALFAGLGITGVHASFRLLLAVPFIIIYLWRLWRGARWPVAALALVALGAGGALVYTPLRSATGRVDALDWGHPRTAAALVDQVSAGRIRRAFADQILTRDARALAAHAEEMAGLLEGDLGVLAILVAGGGALVLLLRRGRRGAGALLVAFVATDFVYSVWINPMGMADRQDGTPAALGVAILAGVGIVAAARVLARAAPFAAGALAAIVAVQPVLAHGGDKLAAAGSDAPRAWAEAALGRAPGRALVLTRSDSLSAELIWLTVAEADRPDVAVIARQHGEDQLTNRAVLGPDGADARRRLWEPGDDAPPAGFLLDEPVGPVGEGAVDHRRSIAEAERIFDHSATRDEVSRAVAVRAFTNLGVMAAAAGDHAAAAEVTERAIALDEQPRTRLNAARYRLALGDDAAARVHAQAAVELDPRVAAAWAVLGVIEARAGQCEPARKDLTRALAIDPDDADAGRNLPLLEKKCR